MSKIYEPIKIYIFTFENLKLYTIETQMPEAHYGSEKQKESSLFTVNHDAISDEDSGGVRGRRLLKFIEGEIIGKKEVFNGPFGPRKILYCDYVASGKALRCIEQFMLKHVIPLYGNTHTTTTVTASQTTSYRKEAKEIIREAVGANDDDVVIFCGSGVTGAVHKLISVLEFPKPPVVFCGPFEHHSNLLPWREMESHVVNIGETVDGKVDLKHLELALQRWEHSGRPLVGSFSAASNVTGVTTDTRKVAALLHQYGAISLWDYATGGPYMSIDMHPKPLGEINTSKDAIFISMHKFVGSPDAPGLLVASKKLFRNKVPSGCGGGTVLFVSENDHRYLKDIESREEGGTPAIIGSIRAGLAMKLKMSVGCDVIMERENELYHRAMTSWKDIPELEVLGYNKSRANMNNNNEHKLAVFSFLVRHLETRFYLHCNYVVALLNDLFGIQSRGGCACAGVYAQHLLGIDREAERRFGSALEGDNKSTKIPNRHESERTENEILRPGFARLNFAYFLSDEDADYIISAVAMIAKHGWKLLPQYRFNPRSGDWKHEDYVEELDLKLLDELKFTEAGMSFPTNAMQQRNVKERLPTSRIDCLKRAENIFLNTKRVTKVEDKSAKFTGVKVRDLRWFLLPSEAQSILNGQKVPAKKRMVFEVRQEIKQKTDAELKRELFGDVSDDVIETNRTNGRLFNEDAKPSPKTQRKKKSVLARFVKSVTCQGRNSVQVIDNMGES